MYKKLLIVVLIFLFLKKEAFPQNIDGDSSWARLDQVLSNYGDNYLLQQHAFFKHREDGLKFWKLYPNDPRRYEWFLKTVYLGKYLYYLSFQEKMTQSIQSLLIKGRETYSLPINEKAIKHWNGVYPNLKKEFLDYYAKNRSLKLPGIDTKIRIELLLLTEELKEFLSLSLNEKFRKNSKIDLHRLKSLFISSGKYLTQENFQKPSLIQATIFEPMDVQFISIYKQYGLDSNDMKDFFRAIKNSSFPLLQNWANQRRLLFTLIERPLLFKHVTIQGDTIDIEKMRGKVVLLNFWSIWCSGCIKKMPAIKEVYDKYKAKGFEVISICANDIDMIEKVKRIEKNVGSEWPVLMIGNASTEGTLGQKIWLKYGFWGVPQLLLLNKEGKLVMLNDKLLSGTFEPLVKKLLNENYNLN